MLLLKKKKKVIILSCFVHLPALLLDIISLSLSSIMFEKCPVGTSALSCNTSLWCFINLTVAGTQGWLGVHFLFQWKGLFFFFSLLPKHQFQPFFNYSIVWEVASYQSLMFLRGNVMTSCSAVIVGGGRERGQNCVAEWINSGAPTPAGIPFQRGRPLVVISHCTGFIVGMLLIVLAVVCMLF